MRVEADRQRHVRSDNRPDPTQQFALGIREGLGHRRAMQVEIHSVDRPGLQGVGQQGAVQRGQAFERFVLHRAGGIGEGPGQRDELHPSFTRNGDRTGERDGGVLGCFDQARAVLQRGKSAGLDEILPSGRAWGEGVGLVKEAANRNPHL